MSISFLFNVWFRKCYILVVVLVAKVFFDKCIKIDNIFQSGIYCQNLSVSFLFNIPFRIRETKGVRAYPCIWTKYLSVYPSVLLCVHPTANNIWGVIIVENITISELSQIDFPSVFLVDFPRQGRIFFPQTKGVDFDNWVSFKYNILTNALKNNILLTLTTVYNNRLIFQNGIYCWD